MSLRLREQAKKRYTHRVLSMEPIESRMMLAVVTVNTHQDIVDPNDQLTSLREAIEITNNREGADEIVFDFDNVEPTRILLRQGELQLTDAVTISGPGREVLTIDANDESRIFNITAEEGEFVFEGLTLTGARGVERDDPNVGGAIRSDTSGLLTLRQSAITNSRIEGWGGGEGISASGNVSIESSTLTGNTSRVPWGLVLAGGHVDVSSSEITENSWGIYAEGNVTIQSSTISGNGATVTGSPGALWPGIIESGGNVTVSSSVISQNEVSAIRTSGDVTIDTSTISENQGGYECPGFCFHIVGGIFAGGDVAITSSTISGNTKRGISAGGIATIESSTVSGNTGGGVSAHGDLIVKSSTIAGNLGNGEPGIKFFRDVHLENSIVAANQGGDLQFARPDPALVEFGRAMCRLRGEDCPEVPPHDPEWIVRHSLIGDNRGTPLVEASLGQPDSNGNLIGGLEYGAIDPRLGPLADNGGPTLTHALLPDSPAINMGDPTAIVGVDDFPQYDQRGEPYSRIFGGRLDMGAVESRPVGDSNGDGVFDSSDLVMVFQAGEYEDGIVNNSGFEEGDWNGDGDFDSSDLVAAFQAGTYVDNAAAVDATFADEMQ